MKNVKYFEHHVDTIFYNPNDKNVFGGLLISKIKNPLAKNGIEYFGNGFICKRNEKSLGLKINGHRVTGSETIDLCSEVLHDIYFKEMGLADSSFNLNDKRYWTSKAVTKVVWD